MQKIYLPLLFSIIIFYNLAANAQTTYHKMVDLNVTDWYVFQDMIAVKPAGGSGVNAINLDQGKYTAMTDTFVSGNIYKKMIHVYSSPGFSQNILVGFIREDTVARKVLFLEQNTTTEVTLYDFSIIQGAVINLNFPNNFGQFPAGNYTVTTLDSVMTRVGYRKQLKLVGPTSDTLIQIESIGSIIHPLYLYKSDYGYGQFSFGSSTCVYPYGLGLACKESNNQKFFQSCTYDLALMNNCIYEYDSCNYYNSCSGIQNRASEIQFRITPNPSTDQVNLEIELDNQEPMNVDIFDISGQKLKTLYTGRVLADNKTITMDVSDFENGFYFLKIYNKDFSLNNPIIIVR